MVDQSYQKDSADVITESEDARGHPTKVITINENLQ